MRQCGKGGFCMPWFRAFCRTRRFLGIAVLLAGVIMLIIVVPTQFYLVLLGMLLIMIGLWFL